MLTYSIRINDNNLEKKEVVWGEKYLSLDHSFVTGVTSQDYHLEKQSQIVASLDGKTNILDIECENVTRQGYVVVKGKEYPVETTTTYNYSEPSSEETKYVEINGVYYYVNNNKITIPNWLVERYSTRYEIINQNETEKVERKYYVPGTTTSAVTATVSDNIVRLDTIYWIEDGKVNIDGNDYIFDPDEFLGDSKGGLKYTEDGACLSPTEVTECDDIIFVPIENACDYKLITKFKLTTSEDFEVSKENISYCNFFYFIKYGENYYPIEIADDGKYFCKIGDEEYELYNTDTNEPITTGNVKTYDDLYGIPAYINFANECFLYMDRILQNSNNGKRLAIYLRNGSLNIQTGDIITLMRPGDDGEEIVVTTDSLNDNFIVYNNAKYQLVDGMMNTVVINDQEYNIVRTEGENCFVDINGEEVPMKKNDNKLQRYGYVIASGVTDNRDLKEEKYDIKVYSGVTINGTNYRVVKSDSGDGIDVISAEPGIVYRMIVDEIVGSSLLICSPYFDRNEFSEDFIDEYTETINNDIVSNQDDFLIFIPNHLFGTREALPSNGKLIYFGSTTSNDYEDVINELKLYVNNGFIRIPLKLEMKAASDQLLDDIVQRDFSEAEKNKAINPIIDMERDVYTPKYIENSKESIRAYTSAGGTFPTDMTNEEKRHAYIGSFTDFKPIYEIRLNPHFRTRNMDNWKVNESYNDNNVSELCNWFIMDYEPYKTILEETGENKRDLSTVSDLLGLLFFTNMDVFYQKSALAKTFMRLSYFDGTNQQTQSMLHSSSVFFDEHRSFKTYIDNSRKNVNDFMLISETTEEHPDILNKINISSEFIGRYNSTRRTAYTYNDADVLNESKRISSRFIIENKYETDTSSEGFYLYIFKNYSENLHPKPIYMKVEFNHAKVGRTIPFLIPMRWSNTATTSPYVYPDRKLTLSDASIGEEKSDLEMMKDGIPLSWVYGQSYIPLYAMYDFKNKEYVYIFDDRYVTVEDGIVNLNLFELKVMNDIDPDSDFRIANININDKQIIVT